MVFNKIDLEPTPPYVKGSLTSEAAAHSVKARAVTSRQQVLDFLALRGEYGTTDDEMVTALGLRQPGPRRIELQRLGLVVDSGQRRKTRAGCLAVVWRRATAGEEQVLSRARQERESRVKRVLSKLSDTNLQALGDIGEAMLHQRCSVVSDLFTVLVEARRG